MYAILDQLRVIALVIYGPHPHSTVMYTHVMSNLLFSKHPYIDPEKEYPLSVATSTFYAADPRTCSLAFSETVWRTALSACRSTTGCSLIGLDLGSTLPSVFLPSVASTAPFTSSPPASLPPSLRGARRSRPP